MADGRAGLSMAFDLAQRICVSARRSVQDNRDLCILLVLSAILVALRIGVFILLFSVWTLFQNELSSTCATSMAEMTLRRAR